MADPSIVSAPPGGPSGPVLGRAMQAWIILMNLVPVAGVLFFGWNAILLLLFYWIETVVIGVVNALKLAVLAWTERAPAPARGVALFFVPFFCLHFGIFCVVHGAFVMGMSSFGGLQPSSQAESFPGLDVAAFALAQLKADDDLLVSVLLMAAFQAGSFLVLWLIGGQWRQTNPIRQMMEPYGRLFVMHATIFIAAIPVILFGQDLVAVLALAALKTGLELGVPWTSIDLSRFEKGWPPKLPNQ